MTDTDHVARLRAWRAFSSQNRPGYDHMADVSYESAPVRDADLDAALDELEQLRRALADVDMNFQLSHGGGWCATCRLPMREGTPVVKTLAVVCQPCAADLAATAGRLDPTRLAARKKSEAGQ